MAKPTAITGLGPRTRISDAAQRLVSARLKDVRYYERKLSSAMEVEDVHDARVATRRLRAAAKLIQGSKQLDRKVKRFQDSLGAVRDLHVLIAWLEQIAGDDDREIQRFVAIVIAHIKRQLPEHAEALRRELRRWSLRTVPAIRAEAREVDDDHRLGGKRIRGFLRKRISRVGECMEDVSATLDVEEAHILRIEVKKLRYVAELLQPAWPDKVDVLLGMLQPLQDILGKLHDADVRLEHLTALAEILPQPGDGVKKLLERVRKDRVSLAAQATALVLRWKRERVVRGMRHLLAEPVA